jgi:dinuclear metal center YbgI/SA1388 family protein
MKIKEILSHLESFAPPGYQEDYDNSGLIAGNPEAECTGVLLSLDCTEDIIQEATDNRCNLVVSHHPLIFRALRSILSENSQGKTLVAAIKNDITIYAIHTNLDNIPAGVNATMADVIGLIKREILFPRAGDPGIGSGMIGNLKEPVPENEILKLIRKGFGIPVIRHSALTGQLISRVALCGGSGSFLISRALQQGAGFFISADIRYHEFFGGEGKMVIADIGHYESEQFTIDLLYKVILEKFPNFAVLKSGKITNPVNYYI